MEGDLKVEEAKQAVHELVQTLHNADKSPDGILVVNEVIKAGSLGHGTAVPGNFDLDMVVYSESVVAVDILREGYGKWLDRLKTFYKIKCGEKVQVKRVYNHSVNFWYDDKIEVDMLVSPFWGLHPRELYSFLNTVAIGRRYDFSCCSSKWQVEFFSHQDNQVKEFIRRAKAWRNKKWSDSKGKPKSFLLSVLVLRAHERAVKTVMVHSTKAMAKKTTEEFVQIVWNHESANIYWEEYYRKEQYPKLFPPSRPRIVDPANPSNNLHETGIHGYHQDHNPNPTWDIFVGRVQSIDLTRSVEDIQSSVSI